VRKGGVPRFQQIVLEETKLAAMDPIWPSDGQHIIYIATLPIFGPTYYILVPVNGGPHERLSGIPSLFDWTGTSTSYTVDPTQLMTTTWADLKAENLKKG